MNHPIDVAGPGHGTDRDSRASALLGLDVGRVFCAAWPKSDRDEGTEGVVEANPSWFHGADSTQFKGRPVLLRASEVMDLSSDIKTPKPVLSDVTMSCKLSSCREEEPAPGKVSEMSIRQARKQRAKHANAAEARDGFMFVG